MTWYCHGACYGSSIWSTQKSTNTWIQMDFPSLNDYQFYFKECNSVRVKKEISDHLAYWYQWMFFTLVVNSVLPWGISTCLRRICSECVCRLVPWSVTSIRGPMKWLQGEVGIQNWWDSHVSWHKLGWVPRSIGGSFCRDSTVDPEVREVSFHDRLARALFGCSFENSRWSN